MDQFLFVLSLLNTFGSIKGLFQKIRSHVKFLFWHPCYSFLTQVNHLSFVSKQLCSCIRRLYTRYLYQVGNSLTVLFPLSSLYHIISNIQIWVILHCAAELDFLYSVANIHFNLSYLNTRFFKTRIVHNYSRQE